MIPQFRVIRTSVNALSLDEASSLVMRWAAGTTKRYVAIANVHLVMEGYDDPAVQRALDGADLVTPDGMPLVMLGKLRKYEITRVYGPDLMEAVLDRDVDRRLRHVLYGGSQETNNALAASIEARWPNTIVAGRRSPPFRALSAEEQAEEIATLNAARADIVWVALGAPKQELWMARMRPMLDAPVLMGVGAAFDFISGRKPQAPAVMQKASLEWLFRLVTEPRRLFWRYAYHNPRFVVLVLWQLLTHNLWKTR